MPDAATLVTFALATLLIALTPGPDQLYIATRSLAQGRGAGVVSALGINTGLCVHVLAAALGLSALIAASPPAFTLLKLLGAGYLVYLGVRTLLSKEARADAPAPQPSSLASIYAEGVVTNLLNPRAVLFFFAFLPQFVAPTRTGASVQMVLLGFLAIGVSLLVDAGIVLLATTFSKHAGRYGVLGRWGKGLAGAVFIVLGLGTLLVRAG